MRSAIIGVIALVLGALAALGYSHYLGEGRELAAVKDQLLKAQADRVKMAGSAKLAKDENDALTGQVQQLIASKNQLQNQVDEAKNSAAPVTPGVPSMFGGADMSGMVKAQIGQMNDEKLEMLEKRLNLTPDQVAKIKAAMDAESKRTEEMTSRMLSGQKMDPQSLAASAQGIKSADQVIRDVLTPDQQTAYKQMQSDQKTSSAESMASMQMNQVAPLLQLSDSQKDQVESVLYQVQMNSEDPSWIQKNVGNVGSNPTAILDAEEKAKEDALASVLTPDQLATFKQQAQAQLTLQRTMMQKFMPATSAPSAPQAAASP